MNDSSDYQNLWYCWWISLKTVLIFPKNFLSFRFDSVEKQNPLYSYRTKSYSLVVIDYFNVTFLSDAGDAAFCLSVNYMLFVYGFAHSRSKYSNAFAFQPAAFPFFVSTTLSFFPVNCPNVTLAINNFCDWITNCFRGVSMQIIEMFFPHLYLFFLAGSF